MSTMFSVVITYYNKKEYIERCISSVLDQNYKNFEIILVNDGSKDDGVDLVQEKFGDRVKIITQKNGGVSSARNTGILNSQYGYIAFLDADDYWSPWYLESAKTVIDKEQNVGIIGAHYTRDKLLIQKNESEIKYYEVKNYFKTAINNTLFLTSATIVKKDFFDHNDAFNTNLKSGEDLDVWFRIIENGGKAFYIENSLVYYSDEDHHQITSIYTDLDRTLVGNIQTLYKELLSKSGNRDFQEFVSKYVYFNIYPYYFDQKTNSQAKSILQQIKIRFSLADYLFAMPTHNFFQKIIKHKYKRLYFKFLFRYIYK
ncbi:glycosyltransferase family A protein [Epilithonimonas sp. JDS]|uniref:glycosyltransferase family 2 protein n=1 Tax=Epilithonimonas sp. JDS TaxID=2902797 RepID=UPI001E51EE1B|nr:glycosyltransferase family A protein [Epilithonimonas sp. JDS]